MKCPECEKPLADGVTFCACGWPKRNDGSGQHYWNHLAEHHRRELATCEYHGTRYAPQSICRLCAQESGW